MAVPSRLEAARILVDLEPPAWFLSHVAAVAEIASFLGLRVQRRGIALDRRLVEAAALLHDVDKLLPNDGPLAGLGHGDAGARWLALRGHQELARAVAAHPVSRLSDERRYPRWAAFATREERLVAYADKRAGQRAESLAARFADWERRFPEHSASLRVARARAERLERDVCAAAGVSPEAVRRAPWVRRALAMVGGAGAISPAIGREPRATSREMSSAALPATVPA